jgi:acetyl esterase/lipase
VTVPADAPPLFVALAADDPFFANGGFGLIESWRAAKKPAEFHLYEQGGHGFGMYPQGHDQHGLVQCLRELVDDARDGQAQGLIATMLASPQ